MRLLLRWRRRIVRRGFLFVRRFWVRFCARLGARRRIVRRGILLGLRLREPPPPEGGFLPLERLLGRGPVGRAGLKTKPTLAEAEVGELGGKESPLAFGSSK